MTTIITHAHAKQLGYCNAGIRKWFAARDKTWQEFREHGVTVEWALAQDDAMAARLAEVAQKAGGQTPAK